MDAKRKVFVVLGSVAVIAVAAVGGGALFFSKSDTQLATQPTTAQTSTSSSTTTSTPSNMTATTANDYKDGTYSATNSYYVPHDAQNSIKTTLTVANGTVSDVSVDDNYSDRESGEYIDFFEQELKSVVVGKSLADLSPSRIGGASLTTEAFSQTLDTIKNDANA